MDRTTCSPSGGEVIKQDPIVVLDMESPGSTHKNDLGSKTTPDVAASTFLSQLELLNNALEPADAEDIFMHRMAVHHHEPLWEAELGPEISPGRIHPPPCLPFECTEDVLLNGEVGVIPEHASLDEGPSRSFMKPEDTPVTVPGFDLTSLSSFFEMLENKDIPSPDTEHILSSDLDSSQPQLEAHEWLQENDQGPSSMSGLDHCLPLQCFEAEKASMVPDEENLSKGPHANSPPQFGLPDPQYDTILEWAEQTFETLPQQQPPCSTQASQPQHFQDRLGQAPSSSNSLSTDPHLNSSRHPVLLDSNYPQPTQLLNSTFFPLGTPSDVSYEYLPPPVDHDTRFNLVSSTFENSPPLVPQVDLNSGSSVSPLNPNHPYHTRPLYCKYPPMNLSCHLPQPNPQTPFWPGSLEQSPAGETRHAMDSLSQKFYVNYRLWQMYCKVAKSVYASSPDAEALACFFIPVIRSVCLQCPEIFFVEAVKAALSEWEKHSNFDRMEYYHTAQKFMEFEEEDLKRLWAVDQAAAHQEAAQQKQTPKHEQSGTTPKPSSSKAAGSSVQKAKGYSRKSHGAQASRKTVQELAEGAQRAYNEIMEDLETRNKKQSEDAKDEEEVHEEEEEEGSFPEYFDEICSQATFLNEAGAGLDMEYISSLLLSDSNPTDMLIPSEVQDNAQNLSTGVTLMPETGHLNLQTTAESISAGPPEELHPPLQTFSAPFSPTLQPGLCMSDGKIIPPLASFKIPAFLNQPNLTTCPSMNPEVPLTNKQLQVPASVSGIHIPPFQYFIPQKTFEMLPLPPGPLPQSQVASGGPSTLQGHFFPANCFIPSMLVQEDVGSFNRHDAFQAIPLTTISSSYNQDRKNLILPLREIKAQNHSDTESQNVHLWPPVTSQVANNLQSSVPHQHSQSNYSESLSLANSSSQNATEPVINLYYTSSQTSPAIANLETKDSGVGSVSETSSQEVEQSQSTAVDSNSRNHQSIDTNIQVMSEAKQKSDSSDDLDTSKIITVGNELMAINEENENVNTFVMGKQKMKESMPDIQEDSDGTYSALCLEKEAKAKMKTVEQICSDGQQLREKSLNESVDHQVGHLPKLPCTPSCSDQDSPTSSRPPVILSPLSLVFAHLETFKEISEACPKTSKEKDEGQLSLPSMYKEGAVSSIQYPCSVELSNLPCDVKTDCSSQDPALKLMGNCLTDVSETKLGQKHFYIPSNDLTLDDVLSDPIFTSDNTEKSSFIEKAPPGGLDTTKSNQDKAKHVKSKTVVIPQTEMDQILQDASQNEDQLKTSTQPGAATDYNAYFNDQQHFSSEESVHVPTNESSSQSSTVTVTQKQSTKHEPVTNDHSGKMREPITRPDKTQEEYLVPSELSAIKLDSTSNDEDDPKLAAHVQTTAEDSLCMSEEKLGQDPKTEASLHEQDRSSTPKNMSLITKSEEKELSTGNKRQSGPTETPNQCDDQKTRIGDGRECENVSTSAKVGQMKEKTMGTDNREKELALKKAGGARRSCQETFHSVTNEKNPTRKTEQKLENSSVPLEKGQSKNLKNKERHMRKGSLQRKEDGLLTKTTGTMARAPKKHFMSLEVSSFLGEAPSESQDGSCNSTETSESPEHEGMRSTERCDSKKHKRESVKNYKVNPCFESMQSEAAAETPDVKKNTNAGKQTGRTCKRTLDTNVKDIHGHSQIHSEVSGNIIASSKTSSLAAMPTRKTRISGTSQVKSTVAAKEQVKLEESVSEIIACNSERTQRGKVNEKPVKSHSDDAQLSRSTSRVSSCGASVAEETAERQAKVNKRDLSSLASEGNDSKSGGRRLKSDASVIGISVRFKNKSKDTTKTKRRDTISEHGKGRAQNQGSDGNRQKRKQTRTWTTSQRIQFEQREKERKSLDEGISESSPDHKRSAEMSGERRGVEEMQKKWKSVAKEENTDKREASVKRCRITRRAESSITTAQQEMIRKEPEKGKRQCRDQKSHAKSRFLRTRKPPLALEAPQTRQSVERSRNDEQKENLTRAKEVNSKGITESLPKKKQKLPEKLTSGFKIEAANLKTPPLEVKDIPSSSQTPRQIRKGSSATSDGPRERRANNKGQQGSVSVRSVHCKKTEQENGGNKWKRQGEKKSTESTDRAKENGKKAQAGKTEARKIENENENQKKWLKGGGIRVRWSDRLGKKQRKRPR